MYSKSTLKYLLFLYTDYATSWYSNSKGKRMYKCYQRLVQSMFAEMDVTVAEGVLIVQK